MFKITKVKYYKVYFEIGNQKYMIKQQDDEFSDPFYSDINLYKRNISKDGFVQLECIGECSEDYLKYFYLHQGETYTQLTNKIRYKYPLVLDLLYKEFGLREE